MEATVRATRTREERERQAAEELAARLLEGGSVEEIAAALLAARRKRKRPSKVTENPEYADMVIRLIKAMVRRVGTVGDIEGLADMVRVQKVLDQAITEAVTELRKPHGVLEHHYSWESIGNVLGITRQAACEKYSPRAPGQPKRVRNRGRTAATVTSISDLNQETA